MHWDRLLRYFENQATVCSGNPVWRNQILKISVNGVKHFWQINKKLCTVLYSFFLPLWLLLWVYCFFWSQIDTVKMTYWISTKNHFSCLLTRASWIWEVGYLSIVCKDCSRVQKPICTGMGCCLFFFQKNLLPEGFLWAHVWRASWNSRTKKDTRLNRSRV